MSGMPDDWGAGGRAVRQSEGRRPRRSDGRHVRARRAEDEEAPELSLPDVPDVDEDDPKTLAEDAQWAAKLRPGRAPSAAGADPATDGGQAPTTQPSDDPWAAAPASASPSTGGDPWETSTSDGTGEVWGSSPGATGESTAAPWAAPPPAASTSSGDLWGTSPAGGASTGDWTATSSTFEPERPESDWGLGDPPATSPGVGDASGWGGGSDATATWKPDAGAWSPEPSSPAPWEPEPWEPAPPAAPPTSQQFGAATAPQAPEVKPWDTQPPLRPKPAAPVSETSTDFGDLFAELARDRQAEPPPAPSPSDTAPRHDDPSVVQAAHAEARRLIEEATGQWLWDADKRSTSDGIAAPATGSGTASAYGLPQPGPTTGGGFGSPTAFGPGGQPTGGYGADSTGPGIGQGHAAPSSFGTPGWSDPLPPPPVPDGSTPFGGAASFAPPGSAPAEVGPSATPPPPVSRELSSTRPPGRRAADADEPGSRLWAPDRRAGEQDETGGVGWLWSVEEHGASPPVPGSWLREPPRPQVHEVDGLARPIEGRRLRQLEGRSQGRRVRQSRRWPFRVAVAAWVVLFAVVCWLYVFPWLEGVLPENF